jgi:hypothetical protein
MSEINTLADLKAGDRVQVFGSTRGQPKGGQDGTVVKVGRKLITVEYGHSTTVFRLETGYANDDYGHAWIKTVAQADEDLRRAGLVERLRDGGLEVRMGRQLPIQTLEAVAKALDAGSSHSLTAGGGESE